MDKTCNDMQSCSEPSQVTAQHVPSPWFRHRKAQRYRAEKRRAAHPYPCPVAVRRAHPAFISCGVCKNRSARRTKYFFARNALLMCTLRRGKSRTTKLSFEGYCKTGVACCIFALAAKERENEGGLWAEHLWAEHILRRGHYGQDGHYGRLSIESAVLALWATAH